jgi:Zn-finger protein
MRQDRTIRAIKIAAVLAALLLVFTLVGSSIWHDHRGESSANCQTCHLSHQTATSRLVANQVSAPVAVGTTFSPADTTRVSGPELTFSISRAPPLA